MPTSQPTAMATMPIWYWLRVTTAYQTPLATTAATAPPRNPPRRFPIPAGPAGADVVDWAASAASDMGAPNVPPSGVGVPPPAFVGGAPVTPGGVDAASGAVAMPDAAGAFAAAIDVGRA